jgi:hypothetical protein
MKKRKGAPSSILSYFLVFLDVFLRHLFDTGKIFFLRYCQKYAHMFFTGLVLCDFVCATLRYGGNDEGGYVIGGNIFPDPSFENLIENDIIIRMEREKEEGEIFRLNKSRNP